MELDKVREILDKVKVPATDPSFYARVFTQISREKKARMIKESDNFKRTCYEEYDDLSRRLDSTQMQESVSVRNVLRSRRLANLLISDKGEILTGHLARVIQQLSDHLYSLGPNRQYDTKRQKHILSVLTALKENKNVLRYLKNVSKPYLNPFAEQIIRYTLQLPANTMITDAHARRAALSALLCYLRQSVGSCFGTAPAIIIHDEQPEQFLKDIVEVLGTGRLKRTFGGVEYSVPFSVSWGIGDLRKQVLLKKVELPQEITIALSPGLLAAFEAAGLVKADLSLRERIEQVQSLLYNLESTWERGQYVVTTPEEIIRRVLLNQLNLTEKDLYEFQHRPPAMMITSLVMPVYHQAVAGAGKGQLCAQYLINFENATNAFKGLADNALLKAWEFTIASFAENKSGFTDWNLYSSLGLRPDEKGGVGHAIYEVITRKLNESNDKVKEFQIEYEVVYGQVKFLEGRLRSATSEKEAQWMRAECQAKANEFYFLEEMRNKLHQRAHRFTDLFNFIIKRYMELFPKYFQEIYDADMHGVAAGPYDDSPAGFRLLYKHGRGNTAQWSRIYNATEFIDALTGFFNATEVEIRSDDEMEGLGDDFTDIVTAIITQLRTPEFLETAFYRMAVTHKAPVIKNPLENLDKIAQKPWAYVSGGTMDTLVSAYYKREQKPTEVGRWVENPTELFVFLADCMKQTPKKIAEEYAEHPNKSMLMHSPTHAFLLKPGLPRFKSAWQNEAFTYTWVRDRMIKPMELFVDMILLDSDMMTYLIKELLEHVPENFKHHFEQSLLPIYGDLSAVNFREHIADKIETDRGLQYRGRSVLPMDTIDSMLYELLPVFHRDNLRERIMSMFRHIPETVKMIDADFEVIVDEIVRKTGAEIISAKSLQELCKIILCLGGVCTSSKEDYHRSLALAAQELGYAMPTPIIIADTNWVKDEFGFVVNPGTGKFEFWRLDLNGTSGAPMSVWNMYLDGSRQDAKWAVYRLPYEYQST